MARDRGRLKSAWPARRATLVALAAGYSVPDITQDIVDQITAHADYPALLAAMKTALAADKNFLDRISDYPEVMRLIRSVATFRTGTTMQTVQMVSAQTTPVPPDGIRHDDFWCTPITEWPCSPWKEYEPWQWFGAINGVISFLPPRPPPFLARSHADPGVHATANPNFVDYALEVYSGDRYIDWFYVPGNASLVEKTLNSGAAYRELYTELELDDTIDRVRFVRYRIDVGSQQAKILSFLNTFRVVTAGLGILMEVGIIEKFLDRLDPERQGRNIATCATGVVNNWRDFYFDGRGAAVEQMVSLVKHGARAGFNALLSCRELLLPGMEEFIAKQVTHTLGEYGAKVLPIVGQIYAVYDFVDETVNEAVPLGISYFSGPDEVDYYVQWNRTGTTPYIARVSKDPPSSTSKPDLIVESASVNPNPLTTGQAFTLSATVRNRGTGASPGTTLRYYRSTNATITPQDTQLDTDWISRMNPSSSRTASTNQTAPSTAGTYYYGSCVDSVADEADTSNNCSSGVRVTVEEELLFPAAPTTVRVVSVTEDSITLAWDAGQSSVQEYRVYQHPADGSAPSLIASTSTTTATVDGLDDGTEYCFSVTAVNWDGFESNPSARVCGMTVFRPVPLDDFHVRLQPGQLRIYLTVRDYGCVDGDEIRVWVNGRIVFSGELSAEPESVIVSVNEGLNPVEVLALNGTGFKGTCSSYPDVNSPAVEVQGLTGGLSPGVSQRLAHRGGSGSRANIIVTVGGSSSLEVRMEDECNDGQAMKVRFFEDASGNISQQSAAWPSRDLIYSNEYTSDGGPTIFDGVLNCTAGYTVCYGARPLNEGGFYWGVDIDGSKDCDNCCTTCPASGRGELSRRLICP